MRKRCITVWIDGKREKVEAIEGNPMDTPPTVDGLYFIQAKTRRKVKSLYPYVYSNGAWYIGYVANGMSFSYAMNSKVSRRDFTWTGLAAPYKKGEQA